MEYAFGSKLKTQFILLFSLFLLLFISHTVLFDIIYGSHYTISINFFFTYHTFSKNFLLPVKYADLNRLEADSNSIIPISY